MPMVAFTAWTKGLRIIENNYKKTHYICIPYKLFSFCIAELLDSVNEIFREAKWAKSHEGLSPKQGKIR